MELDSPTCCTIIFHDDEATPTSKYVYSSGTNIDSLLAARDALSAHSVFQ